MKYSFNLKLLDETIDDLNKKSIGDAGIVSVLISPEELRYKHFEDAFLNMDCY